MHDERSSTRIGTHFNRTALLKSMPVKSRRPRVYEHLGCRRDGRCGRARVPDRGAGLAVAATGGPHVDAPTSRAARACACARTSATRARSAVLCRCPSAPSQGRGEGVANATLCAREVGGGNGTRVVGRRVRG